MKKFLIMILAAALILSAAGCGNSAPTTEAETAAPLPSSEAPASEVSSSKETAQSTEAETEPSSEEAAAPLPYEEYLRAPLDTEVTISAYIQYAAVKEDERMVCLFLQDADGGYYIYDMPTRKEDLDRLTKGVRLQVTGRKSEWSGEIEIQDVTDYRIFPEDTCLFDPQDITVLMGTEAVAAAQNQRVRITATVAPSFNSLGEEVPFLYTYNGNGEAGQNQDLYFNASIGRETYTFVVESDECPEGSAVYSAVTKLEIGEIIDMDGFLYWYHGAQPHIHSLSRSSVYGKGVGALTHAQYIAADKDTGEDLVIEAYIQTVARVDDSTFSLFLEDAVGGYYVYRLYTEADDAARIIPGTHLRITGKKTDYLKEVELADGAVYEILDGYYLAGPKDVTALITDEEALRDYMNCQVKLGGGLVVPSYDADGEAHPFLYKYNGSGEHGDDLYFTVLLDGRYVTCVVESDEFVADTALYDEVCALQAGTILDLEASLYWYSEKTEFGAQPHVRRICAVTPEKEEDVAGYAEYMAAEYGREITVEGYIQQRFTSSDGQRLSLFLHDGVGGYFISQLAATPEEAEAMQPGTHWKIRGFKAGRDGSAMITDGVAEALEGEYLAAQTDLAQTIGRSHELSFYIGTPFTVAEAVIAPSYRTEQTEPETTESVPDSSDETGTPEETTEPASSEERTEEDSSEENTDAPEDSSEESENPAETEEDTEEPGTQETSPEETEEAATAETAPEDTTPEETGESSAQETEGPVEYPYLFKADGSGSYGNNIYFNAVVGDLTCRFIVSSLCDSALYDSATQIQIGDTVSLEAYLFWYEDAPLFYVTQIRR